MFESEDDDDDPEVQEQIKMALASSGLLGDLQLSESKDESELDSPSSDDDEGDPNKTKQYYKNQKDEAVKDSGLKPDSSIPAVMDPPAVPGNPGNPDGSNPSSQAKHWPSGNTGKGRLGWLPTRAAASPGWRTGARLPGTASNSAPGFASGSPAPSVA